jgi:hypothetical protein
MPRERPEITASYLTEVRDREGRVHNIGAGSTVEGHVVLILPPEGPPPHLNQEQTLALLRCLRRALADATTRR